MKAKLTEALEIVQAMMQPGRRYPVGCVRLHHLLSQLVDECWDDTDTATLPLWFEDEPPFPAA
jgi:hypothetical protein